MIRILCWFVVGMARRQLKHEAWERIAGYAAVGVLAMKVLWQGARAFP
jgi:hypothetical protein